MWACSVILPVYTNYQSIHDMKIATRLPLRAKLSEPFGRGYDNYASVGGATRHTEVVLSVIMPRWADPRGIL